MNINDKRFHTSTLVKLSVTWKIEKAEFAVAYNLNNLN
jgi:hypothetical protein